MSNFDKHVTALVELGQRVTQAADEAREIRRLDELNVDIETAAAVLDVLRAHVKERKREWVADHGEIA